MTAMRKRSAEEKIPHMKLTNCRTPQRKKKIAQDMRQTRISLILHREPLQKAAKLSTGRWTTLQVRNLDMHGECAENMRGRARL
jgi:hypothetical protein